MDPVRLSVVGSLIVQSLTAVLNIWGLTLKIRPKALIFRTLLVIEFVVQLIEVIAYVFLARLLFKKSTKRIMTIRYIDWTITTPTMLITLMAFLSGAQTLSAFWEEHKRSVMIIIILDWVMIGCGYVNEQGGGREWITGGFVALFIMFGLIGRIFSKQIKEDCEKRFIYAWFLVLWTLYGVFAFLGFNTRNTGYNIIDVFSKNVTGVFLVWKLTQNRIP